MLTFFQCLKNGRYEGWQTFCDWAGGRFKKFKKNQSSVFEILQFVKYYDGREEEGGRIVTFEK